MESELKARREQDAHAHELHHRLVEGDPLAPSELVGAFSEELVRRVRARAQITNDDFIVYDAVTDALLAYAQQPTKYNPTKSGLLTYLTMSAYGDYLNMLARERRREKREIPLEYVEHRLDAGNNLIEDLLIEDVLDTVMEREGILTPEERIRLLQQVSERFPDPQDRQILNLMLLGERKTAAYSAELGILDSDKNEQRRIVKRHKDRLSKRLKRLGEKLRDQYNNR